MAWRGGASGVECRGATPSCRALHVVARPPMLQVAALCYCCCCCMAEACRVARLLAEVLLGRACGMLQCRAVC